MAIKKRAALGVAALTGLLVLASAAVAQISSDARLAGSAVLNVESQPVGEILADYSEACGVTLTADPALADSSISGHISARPAHEVLQLIADLLLGSWTTCDGGYRLTLSELGRQKEAEITRNRDWALEDRRRAIAAGLEVSTEEWQAALEDVPDGPIATYASDAKLPAGFVVPDDIRLAQSLCSPYRRTVLDLLLALPESTWQSATEPPGVEVETAEAPEAKRVALAKVIEQDAPPLPFRTRGKETWPREADREAAVEALVDGKGSVAAWISADHLGRWRSVRLAVRNSGKAAFFSEIHIGRHDPREHGLMHVMIAGRPYLNYAKVAPEADDSELVQKDTRLAESLGDLEWPPKNCRTKEGFLLLDRVLETMGRTLGIDYLATRYEKRASRQCGARTRGQLIDSTAVALGANWERVGDVYLFRESDWPLKRERCIPDSFFTRYEAKLSPERYLSLDDMSAAASELNAKKKQWWLDNAPILPLEPYSRKIAYDSQNALSIWAGFTAAQKARMRIVYDPAPGHDPFAGEAGIEMTELERYFQSCLLDMIRARTGRRVDPGDVRIGWMHYRVSDGYERDRLSYQISKDGKSGYRSCFFEVFHPNQQDWEAGQ